MTKDTIEEIVQEFRKKISSCTEVEGFHDCVTNEDPNDMAYKNRAEAWLTQTLKDYGDAVRGESRKQAIQKYRHHLDKHRFDQHTHVNCVYCLLEEETKSQVKGNQ